MSTGRPGARSMPPAEAGDVGAALGDRPGSSRMAKAYPRWKREVPRRFRHVEGPEGCQRRPGAALRGESRRSRLRPAQVSGGGTRRPGRCTRNPSRQRRGSRLAPASRARPRVPISRRRARRPCPGDGNQVQPDTRMRSSASDDPHRGVVGKSSRLGAQSHLICMPQDADRHDAAIGADRRSGAMPKRASNWRCSACAVLRSALGSCGFRRAWSQGAW